MNRFLTTLLFLLLVASHSQLLADDERIRLEVEGVGVSLSEARLDAIRNALNQTVRQLIITDRRIENDEIVMNRILSTANGFISHFKLLESRRDDDGMVSIRAQITVETEQVQNFFGYGDFGGGGIDGQSLFAEAQRQQLQTRMAAEILGRALSGYPAYAHEIDLESIQPDSGGSSFALTIAVRPVASYFESLKQTVDAISNDTIHRNLSRRNQHDLQSIAYNVDTQAPMVCVAEGVYGDPPRLFWRQAECRLLPEAAYSGGPLKDQSPEPLLIYALLDREGQSLHGPPGCVAAPWSDRSRFMLSAFFDVDNDPDRRFIPGGTRRLIIGAAEASMQFTLNAAGLDIGKASRLVGLKVLASREYSHSELPAGAPSLDRPTLYFADITGPGMSAVQACSFLLRNSG